MSTCVSAGGGGAPNGEAINTPEVTWFHPSKPPQSNKKKKGTQSVIAQPFHQRNWSRLLGISEAGRYIGLRKKFLVGGLTG